MELGFTEVMGRKTQVATGGDGPPLLYLHSAAGEAAEWMDLLHGLAEVHTIHAPLAPGFFASEGVEQINHIEDLVFHYVAYMDGQGWEAVDVMGCSLGGWLGLEIAARHPERVGRMVVAGSAGIRLPDVPMADMFKIRIGQEEQARAMLFHDTSHPLAEMVMPKITGLDDETAAVMFAAMGATAKVAWNPYLHNPKLEPLLGRITAETLVAWGAQDQLIPAAYGRRLAELIPGARLELIDGCGHMPWLEKPDELLALARGHLAGRAAAAR